MNDRDCENCIHKINGACKVWECKFEPKRGMTKEEAIKILKELAGYEKTMDLIQNYSVSVQDALYMAIKALDQKPKSEWQQDHEILKAYSDGANDVLDEIKADIEQEYKVESEHPYGQGLSRALEIIDRYKSEGNEQ